MKHLAVEIACRSSVHGWTANTEPEPVAATESR
jgi:hypothetical protein